MTWMLGTPTTKRKAPVVSDVDNVSMSPWDSPGLHHDGPGAWQSRRLSAGAEKGWGVLGCPKMGGVLRWPLQNGRTSMKM